MLPRIAILTANFSPKRADFSGIWRITARHTGRAVRALRTAAFSEISGAFIEFSPDICQNVIFSHVALSQH